MNRWSRWLDLRDEAILEVSVTGAAAKRAEIEDLMVKFLKKGKIKKIKRGKSGLSSQWYRDNWGFMA